MSESNKTRIGCPIIAGFILLSGILLGLLNMHLASSEIINLSTTIYLIFTSIFLVVVGILGLFLLFIKFGKKPETQGRNDIQQKASR